MAIVDINFETYFEFFIIKNSINKENYERFKYLYNSILEILEEIENLKPIRIPTILIKRNSENIYDLAAPRLYINSILANMKATVCRIFLIESWNNNILLEEWKRNILFDNIYTGMYQYIRLITSILPRKLNDKKIINVTWNDLINEWNSSRILINRSERESNV